MNQTDEISCDRSRPRCCIYRICAVSGLEMLGLLMELDVLISFQWRLERGKFRPTASFWPAAVPTCSNCSRRTTAASAARRASSLTSWTAVSRRTRWSTSSITPTPESASNSFALIQFPAFEGGGGREGGGFSALPLEKILRSTFWDASGSLNIVHDPFKTSIRSIHQLIHRQILWWIFRVDPDNYNVISDGLLHHKLSTESLNDHLLLFSLELIWSLWQSLLRQFISLSTPKTNKHYFDSEEFMA